MNSHDFPKLACNIHPRQRIQISPLTLIDATGECALGRVLVARSVNGVCAILIGADHDEAAGGVRRPFSPSHLVTNEAIVHDDLAKVIRFVDKPAEGFHLTLDMRGTPLERRVWEEASRDPCRKDSDLHGVGARQPVDRQGSRRRPRSRGRCQLARRVPAARGRALPSWIGWRPRIGPRSPRWGIRRECRRRQCR